MTRVSNKSVTDEPTCSALAPRLYSADTLAEAIGVPPQRICLWISEGLLEPTSSEGDDHYFDFKQMAAAQTLRELADTGADLKRLRRGMKRLRRWLPDEPAKRLVPGDAGLHVRLDEGQLAEADGQLRLEFGDDGGQPVSIAASQQTPHGWFALGAEHYAAGETDAAIEAFRRALQVGGPDAKLAFSLAQALAEAGRNEQAAERYLQVVELEPLNADAWNNLGVVLCALDHHEGACQAYQRALEISPENLRARYNLADALDEAGRHADAAPHWRAYLQRDTTSAWAAHARRRLSAI